MVNKKLRRIKRIISTHLLRIGIVAILLLMITLMVCGCLYIFELIKKNEDITTRSDEKDSIGALSEGVSKTEKTSNLCVVLDAGHGGNDGGTVTENVIEKNINLSVTLKVKALLEENNIEVILTRNSDKYVSLDERVTIANNAKADVFVSLHCNYFEDDESIMGMECYYNSPDEAESKEYAESIINTCALSDDIITREAKFENFYVLRNTICPAVLVEMGFLSNEIECQKLINNGYQQNIAERISAGIIQKLIE